MLFLVFFIILDIVIVFFQVATWTAITLRLGLGIFDTQAAPSKMTNGGVKVGGSRGGSRSGSATGSKKVAIQQRPSSKTQGNTPKKTYGKNANFIKNKTKTAHIAHTYFKSYDQHNDGDIDDDNDDDDDDDKIMMITRVKY